MALISIKGEEDHDLAESPSYKEILAIKTTSRELISQRRAAREAIAEKSTYKNIK